MTSHGSEWPSLKCLQIINAGEGVEKRVPSHTVGSNVNWSSYGKQYGGSLKNRKRVTKGSNNFTPPHISRKNKNPNSKRYLYQCLQQKYLK